MHFKTNSKRVFIFFLLVFTINGCGGGSSSDSSSQIILPTQWTPGVYQQASSLKNYCESPRPTSEGFADKTGSTFLEKMWLRSWSNDIYLWYNEIFDQDVDLFDSPQSYFEVLKTIAVTASGTPRDQFHFTANTAEYNQQVSTGASIGFGVQIDLISTAPPRKAVIALVESNSPAAFAGVLRGDEIISIDGEDFVNGDDINTLNNGLFPQKENESHVFVLREAGSNQTKTVTLRSSVVVTSPVQNTSVITTPSGKVGYLTLNTFGTNIAEEALVNAFNALSAESVEDLVLDLRYNGGGFLAISSQLAYMIAGPSQTNNNTYYKQVFNDKHPNINPVTGGSILPVPFVNIGLGFSTTENTPLPTLHLNRVFVLTTGSTCSASEALINGLRGIGLEVVLIGGTTCGKPYGFYATDNCGTTYFTISFKGVNHLGFGDYADGFSPANSTNNTGEGIAGCEVEDDYQHQLGDVDEGMLNAALNYRKDFSCPDIAFRTASAKPSEEILQTTSNDLLSDDRVRNKLLLQRIAIESHQ